VTQFQGEDMAYGVMYKEDIFTCLLFIAVITCFAMGCGSSQKQYKYDGSDIIFRNGLYQVVEIVDPDGYKYILVE